MGRVRAKKRISLSSGGLRKQDIIHCWAVFCGILSVSDDRLIGTAEVLTDELQTYG